MGVWLVTPDGVVRKEAVKCAYCGEPTVRETICDECAVALLKGEEMRSTRPSVIHVSRSPNVQNTLSFVALGHRQLEKTKPSPTDVEAGVSQYAVPVDLMRVAGFPEDIIAGVEEIKLEYKK